MPPKKYPLPDSEFPLRDITDVNMVQYWIDNGYLNLEPTYHPPYSKYNNTNKPKITALDECAETVDIALLLTEYQSRGLARLKISKKLCDTITFYDMLRMSSQLSTPLTLFQYTTNNDDNNNNNNIYYRIIDILQNANSNDIDRYLDEYSNIYPNLLVLLSTAPHFTSSAKKKNLDQYSINPEKSSRSIDSLYYDYLICTTRFNTFNPLIFEVFLQYFAKVYDIMHLFDPITHSPKALQYIIEHKNYDSSRDTEYIEVELNRNSPSFHPDSLKILLDSKKVLSSVQPILNAYVSVDDIDTVKLILDGIISPILCDPLPRIMMGNDNTTISTTMHDSIDINETISNTGLTTEVQESKRISLDDNFFVLHRAQSKKTIDLLISYGANVNVLDGGTTLDMCKRYPIQDSVHSLEVFESLLSHKANVNVFDNSQHHIIHNISNMCDDVLELIVPLLETSPPLSSSKSSSMLSSSSIVPLIHPQNTTISTTNTTSKIPPIDRHLYSQLRLDLSQIPINLPCSLETPLWEAFKYKPYLIPHLVQYNASPNIFRCMLGSNQPSNQEYVTTYDVVEDDHDTNNNKCGWNNTIVNYVGKSKTVTYQEYQSLFNTHMHFIDLLMFEDKWMRDFDEIYHSIYNMLKYKSYPMLYMKLTNTPCVSWLSYAIHNKHINMTTMLAQYLLPINIKYMSYGSPSVHLPLNRALIHNTAYSRKSYYDIQLIWSLLQYGGICNYEYNNENIPKSIRTLVFDVAWSSPQYFQDDIKDHYNDDDNNNDNDNDNDAGIDYYGEGDDWYDGEGEVDYYYGEGENFYDEDDESEQDGADSVNQDYDKDMQSKKKQNSMIG